MQQVTVPASALAARDSRAFLATFCRSHAVPAEVLDDAVLLISEIVGNAYLHARSGAQIQAEYTQSVQHVEVADDSPPQAPAAPRRPGGHRRPRSTDPGCPVGPLGAYDRLHPARSSGSTYPADTCPVWTRVLGGYAR